MSTTDAKRPSRSNAPAMLQFAMSAVVFVFIPVTTQFSLFPQL